MKDLPERATASIPAGLTSDLVNRDSIASSPEHKPGHSGKAFSWPGFFAHNFSFLESHISSSSCEKKVNKSRNTGWTATVKRVVTRGAMRRLQERILGTRGADVSNST